MGLDTRNKMCLYGWYNDIQVTTREDQSIWKYRGREVLREEGGRERIDIAARHEMGQLLSGRSSFGKQLFAYYWAEEITTLGISGPKTR